MWIFRGNVRKPSAWHFTAVTVAGNGATTFISPPVHRGSRPPSPTFPNEWWPHRKNGIPVSGLGGRAPKDSAPSACPCGGGDLRRPGAGGRGHPLRPAGLPLPPPRPQLAPFWEPTVECQTGSGHVWVCIPFCPHLYTGQFQYPNFIGFAPRPAPHPDGDTTMVRNRGSRLCGRPTDLAEEGRGAEHIPGIPPGAPAAPRGELS